MMRSRITLFLCFLLAGMACNRDKKKSIKSDKEVPKRSIDVPIFNRDSAYSYVKKQVDFGPRIPNTKAHVKTSEYLINSLKKFGAAVIVQDFTAMNYEGDNLQLKNIVASFYPEKQKRILLAAHWDTRPFADKDKEKPNAQFDGANDGASGVGVLLEIARLLGASNKSTVGVDIIFFDGEDWGERNGEQGKLKLPDGYEEWWCLGSQYWSKHKHKTNYAAYYGILLDLVGAKGSKFYREGTSVEFAPSIVEKIWSTAIRLGYSDIFINQIPGSITDDHLFVNEVGKIPMADIIHYDPVDGFFGNYHHTRKDNMNLIDKEILGVVGTTVLNVIYYEE
jgi:glutaminyl-peptide cyclotransferase